MRAGRLRHVVTIEQPVQTRDETTGAVVLAWTPVHTNRAADIVPLKGRELIAAQAVQSEIFASCHLRYVAGITQSMRLVHRGVTYNIRAVLPDRTGARSLTLMLSAGLTDGR